MTSSQPRPSPAGGSQQSRRQWLSALIVVSLLGPAASLLAIWLPEIVHYHAATPEIGRDVVAELRRVPDDQVLGRIDGVRFGLSRADSDAPILAEEILAGRFHTRDGEVLPARLEPTAEYLRTGSGSAQLQTSSLAVAETLLDAYRATGNERYFDAALTSVLAWARFERSAWIPVGFLWNDHAVAARVLVLTRLWREYRTRADFDPARAAQILAFVARSTELLSRPSHYTARTNHGIMQDLALLHAGIAFPRLPGAAERTGVALDRLAMHLPFYVSSGGLALEHSAGYQDFAIRLLYNARNYEGLVGASLPGDLAGRYAAAECLQRHLTRPDGSLPLYGDTLSAVRPRWLVAENAAVTCDDQPESRVDEDFGIASLRSFGRPGAQLFMTWANFPGRSHKHDDELATWLWLDGQDWWAASGYWPYDDVDWSTALSWRGANAPHAVGERRAAGSDSRLLHVLSEGPVQLLDVERRAPNGRVYRRQALGIGALGFLSLDSTSGTRAVERFESVWTLVPGVTVRPLDDASSSFALRDTRSGRELEVSFAGEGQEVQRLFGSRDPFGGLVARDGVIRRSEAISVTAPFGSWSVAFWRPNASAANDAATVPAMSAWSGPEQWSLSLPGPAGNYVLTRNGPELSLSSPSEGRRAWRLASGAVNRPLLERAAALYGEAAARYPPFRDYVEYRMRATAGVGALFFGQYLILWVLAWLGAARGTSITVLGLAWAATGWWLYYWYLM